MSGPALTAAHRHEVRVYYEDTDAAGIVYYANYLRFAERARTELLRAAGLDHPTLLARHGGLFAVRRCSVDYRRPARLDDRLVVETEVVRASGARLEMCQRVVKEGVAVVVIDVTLAFLDHRRRPARLPEAVRELLAGATSHAALE